MLLIFDDSFCRDLRHSQTGGNKICLCNRVRRVTTALPSKNLLNVTQKMWLSKPQKMNNFPLIAFWPLSSSTYHFHWKVTQDKSSGGRQVVAWSKMKWKWCFELSVAAEAMNWIQFLRMNWRWLGCRNHWTPRLHSMASQHRVCRRREKAAFTWTDKN